MNPRKIILLSSLLVVFPFVASANEPVLETGKVDQERVRELKKREEEAKREIEKMEREAAKNAAKREREAQKKANETMKNNKTCKSNAKDDTCKKIN